MTISHCRIESVQASAEFGVQANQSVALAGGIGVYADPAPPNMSRPGHPENFSGTLAIVNNEIEMGATPGALFLGITIFAVGKSPDREVDIYVSENNIRNVSEPAINLRVIGGQAHVERNVLITGAVSNGGGDAIRVVGAGSFLIAHNSIDCGWMGGNVTGIGAFSLATPNTPEASATIVDNDVTMSAPEGAGFGPNSAGIAIKGPSEGNMVMNNRIRGRTTAGLSVVRLNGGTPRNTSFVANDLDGFQSSLADVFVDAGASNTVVIGRQVTVEDRGSGTASDR